MPASTKETSLNTKLAEYLRRQGLDAVEEQTLQGSDGSRKIIDILVDLDSYAVAIEAEFAPKDGRADALSRLTSPELYWRGLPIRSVYALTYPVLMQRMSPPDAYRELKTTSQLIFSHRFHPNMAWRESTEIPHSHDWSPELGGSVIDLAELLRDYWTKTDSGASIDAMVKLASNAIQQASECLNRVFQSGERGSDPASTKALIWLNALLFQELLSVRLSSRYLPRKHRITGIPKPLFSEGVLELLDQWETILKINWWPIFHVARESLEQTPSEVAAHAISILKRVAKKIAEERAIERHDIAGRIFHRLLDSRKFLATNYTTIPSAILLSGLAFDDNHELWNTKDFSDLEILRKLTVVDPACGSGTLLMAAAQEIIKRSRRYTELPIVQGDKRPRKQAQVTKALLENSLYGFDVVPAAIHLAASTLSMSETRQVISSMNLWRMRHGVFQQQARLGSLDMLTTSDTHGNAGRLALFQDSDDATRIHGTGEERVNVRFPQQCDLIIANPPYTRAGGPGSTENTAWNPIFGSLMNKTDKDKMTKSLKRAIKNTPARLYSGLGSAFVVLADENIQIGGRLAFVLPSAVVTGSSWRKIRNLLLKHYHIDWLVTSHDPRQRRGQAGLPGRVFSSFSESTNISEVLLVATRVADVDPNHSVRFVNLRHNLTDILDAIALTRCILTLPHDETELMMGERLWGNIQSIKQRKLSSNAWIFNAFVQPRITEIADSLIRDNSFAGREVPLAPLSQSWRLGPYHMQIKNPKQGLFHCDENVDPIRQGYPALWHHKAKRITTLKVQANAWLTPRAGISEEQYMQMLEKRSRLQIACEVRHNTQRVGAVITDQRMLGVRSWISLSSDNPREGDEETLCLWLNSTLGLLLRMVYGNRPYPGRSLITHSNCSELRVLDVDALSEQQLRSGKAAFLNLQSNCLSSFDELHRDLHRREIDEAIISILGQDPVSNLEGRQVMQQVDMDASVKQLAKALSLEPNVSVGKVLD